MIGSHGPGNGPPTSGLWPCAKRPIRSAALQFDEYRERLRMYARQPVSWSRRLRYGLARVLCGRGPFAPYLDQEKWETQCQTVVCRRTRILPRV